MIGRLPRELRAGVIPDLLTWFIQCAGMPGTAVEARSDRVDNIARWHEAAGSIRSAAYATPYSSIDDYMDRWWYLPELFGERARVHRIRRSDGDRHLHDHPWHFVSLILEGGYTETLEVGEGPVPMHERRRYRAGDVVFRHAEHRHRLEIDDGDCWSLVFTSHTVREWGFWTPEGFVPWRKYDAARQELAA